MNKNKNSKIEEIFNLAVQHHSNNILNEAQNLYNQVLIINPNHSSALNNLGVIYINLKEYLKAKECFEKAIEINPNYADAHFNLGGTFYTLGEFQKAKGCYEKVIEINNVHLKANNNLGIIFHKLGEYQKAKECYEKAIEINPNYENAHYNLGGTLLYLSEIQKARNSYKKAIEINNYNTKAYWNLHGAASDIDEALSILKKLYRIDNKYTEAKIMISALEGYKGNFSMFDELVTSSNSNHPYTRSIKWVFSLPKLPKIYFDKFNYFDAVIALTESSRPFYEFGVYKGASFKYLINTFKKGFGFDTFSGLPEDWHHEPKGTYSSSGAIPEIKGAEFIVGKFEDTLPDFFLKERPVASLINFDADLYSSTLCALNYSNKIIDEKTILIFDEFIMSDKWEEDEFKALNEFCNNMGYNYDVIAISFFSKQVAVKLKRN